MGIMSVKQIKQLAGMGIGADGIYMIAAGGLHLYGVAFFGHKATAQQRQKLQRVWKRILTTLNHA